MQVYQLSKLKKLMNMITYLMQDTLRNVAINSLMLYQKYIDQLCNYTIKIHNLNDIDLHYSVPARQHSLFLVDLQLKDNQLVFSTSITDLIQTPLILLNKAFDSLQHIKPLETFIMNNLFWKGNISTLAVIQKYEPFVQQIYQHIQQQLSHKIQVCHEILSHFQIYQTSIMLNIEQYINDFLNNKKMLNNSKSIEKEIKKLQAEKQHISLTIPTEINVG